jgi:hypothetical protein
MSRATHETYTLIIERDRNGRIAAFSVSVDGLNDTERHVRLNGYKTPVVTHHLFDLVKRYGVTGRQWSSGKPIELNFRDAGPHGELFLRTVKPVRKTERIDRIARVLAEMTREEALYWCARTTRRFGAKALRLICDGAK